MAVDPSLIPEDEPERIAALRRYDILDTPPDGAFERLTSLAAKHFSVPIAIVSIVDSDRIWFKSHHGVAVDEIGRDPGLCASAILQPGPWVVENAELDPRTLANPLVVGELGLRFYAGVPLVTRDGYRLGTLCVIDQEPRAFADEDAGTLADLAAVVMDELELRLAARQAVRHETQLREQAERMARELQESLLPSRLPRPAGVELAPLYRPAHADVVGGDFYDAFEIPEALVLVVGDVSGKGPRAAAVTALARHTIRTACLDAGEPAEVLDTLNRAMLMARPDGEFEHFCTVLVAWLRPTGLDGRRRIDLASAGHPPAVLRRPDGKVEPFGGGGPPAGWYTEARFARDEEVLDPGDAIVLFTDGISEARSARGLLGADALARALAPVEDGADGLVGAIEVLIGRDDVELRDDVAVLAAHVA